MQQGILPNLVDSLKANDSNPEAGNILMQKWLIHCLIECMCIHNGVGAALQMKKLHKTDHNQEICFGKFAYKHYR